MRILVDANEEQVAALDALAKREKRPRAAVIRAAIDDYVARHQRQAVKDGFGLWGKDGEDGLAYQERLRSEW
ncbi:CopG family transcriptional regulator [Brevundimonas sp. LM2]|uniref:ribbon-helix-helix protein, CopG family n=1 Tax=Brevundimonas sp. LM2 TaxID=1938605 RepID=UPI000983A9B5|nr:ribbon-helix-helix protein, CopG family [Brevundimonas sp. LM2]AQR63241.1 CopG family transcriptional regulator [Brevundimonas sp. LM2]